MRWRWRVTTAIERSYIILYATKAFQLFQLCDNNLIFSSRFLFSLKVFIFVFDSFFSPSPLFPFQLLILVFRQLSVDAVVACAASMYSGNTEGIDTSKPSIQFMHWNTFWYSIVLAECLIAWIFNWHWHSSRMEIPFILTIPSETMLLANGCLAQLFSHRMQIGDWSALITHNS